MALLGLAISNGLVAIAGALFAQTFGFADVSLGVGTIVIGLASLILGEAVFSKRKVIYAVLASIIGAVLYRLAISLALNLGDVGFQASDLNLITAVLIAVAMGLPQLSKSIKGKKR
jgi:putative ABC transport system permease protein